MASNKPFKVHLYKVRTGDKSKALADIIQQIRQDPLEARVRKLGFQQFRLETAAEPTDSSPFWLLDFTKLRFDGGPGKASKATPVESFQMTGGYGFAEETAVLYDEVNGFVVMQYNHYGPRSQMVADYLSMYEAEQPNEFEFQLQLNKAAQARLANKKIFTRLRIRIAPTKLSQDFRKENVSLVSALQSQTKTFGGDYAFIEVGISRENSGSLNVKKWLPSFLKLANDEHEAVDSLSIAGREEFNYPIDWVDLIKERLETVIKNMPFDEGLRTPQEERYKALKRAYNGWKSEGIIS